MGTVEQSLVKLLNVVDSRGSRHRAVNRLKRMLPRIDFRNRAIKIKLYQILPVFLAYFLMRGEQGEALRLTLRIIEHEREEAYLNLLRKWTSYFIKSKQNIFPVAEDFANLIAYEEIEFFMSMCRFLKTLKKLHKYIYFFANLTYVEFLSIDEENVPRFVQKMGLLPITDGARGAIVTMVQELNWRVAMLRGCAKGNIQDFKRFHRYVSHVLSTPIRRADFTICVKEEIITFLLIDCLEQLSMDASGPRETEKIKELLEQAVSMKYVFNEWQNWELQNIQKKFRDRCMSPEQPSNSYERRSQETVPQETSVNNVVMKPKPIEILRVKMFHDDEIQSGYERTVSSILSLLKDD